VPASRPTLHHATRRPLFIDDHCTDPEDPGPSTWSKEQLVEMDTRFSERLEEAFRLGLERRESAASQVKLPVSPGPRWSTPLTREIQEGLWRSSAASIVMVAR
jgi:hypothetical protein